jgi:N-formylmaleamate deformylase
MGNFLQRHCVSRPRCTQQCPHPCFDDHDRSAPRGFSDWSPTGDYTVDGMVADLEQFVGALELSKSVIDGHSLGAVVAIAYSAKNPSHVDKLVLEDGGPTTLPDGSLPPRNIGQKDYAGTPTPMPRSDVYPSWSEMVAAQAARSSDAPSPLILESRFVRATSGTVRERKDTVGLWKTARGESFTHPWPLVRALTVPTLLIRGDRGLVPEPIAKSMVAANPLVQYMTIRNAGHSVHTDQASSWSTTLRLFLGVKLDQ